MGAENVRVSSDGEPTSPKQGRRRGPARVAARTGTQASASVGRHDQLGQIIESIGPKLLWPPGLVALFAFIAVMVVGGVSELKELDWEYLIFFGVALSVASIAEGLSLDKIVGLQAATWLTQLGLGGAAFVILAGVLTILVKSVLAADQAILLLALALIPVATAVGISPWLAAVAILALGLSWHVPAQSPEYLVAYGATHGRLYSHVQARRMAFVYEAIALAGLAVCLPYWHLLGLL